MNVKNTATFVEQFISANGLSDFPEFPAFTPVLSGCVHFLDTLPAARTIAVGTLLIEQGRIARSVYLIETGL